MNSFRLTALSVALASIFSSTQAATLETSINNLQITETGNTTYDRVMTTVEGGSITVTNGPVTVDHSANTTVNAPSLLVMHGGTINLGTLENPLTTVTIKQSWKECADVQDYPYWTQYVLNGTLNINADTFIQDGSGHGLYAIGREKVAEGKYAPVDSVVNYNVKKFESKTAYTALHAREGVGAVINVGSAGQPLESFVATRTVEGSGVSLLQVNEGATINIDSKYVELNAYNTRTGGGAIGTGAWGNLNITAEAVKITGSINGDYGGKSASNEDSVFKVSITTGLFEMDGDIYAGVTGQAENKSEDLSVSTATLRKEQINVTATNANSTLTGNVEAYNKSETTINFVNGGTFKGDIKTFNYELNQIASNVNAASTTAKITLDGSMLYKGEIDMVGDSTLNLNGLIDAAESTVSSIEGSTVNVAQSSIFKTVTSTSSAGVNIAENASLAVVSGNSSITNLNSLGTLLLEGNATATITNLSGVSTIALDTLKNNVSVETIVEGGSLEAKGTSNFNDENKNSYAAAEALLEAVSVTNGEVTTILLDEGAVNNPLSATVKDGKLVEVQEGSNSKLSALSSTTALLNLQFRHEMNDLTKRMGELRDSSAGIGSWVRLYGSEQKYGAQNVNLKSTSIQVGADYAINDWVVGGAFSYTDGSTEYSNGTGDTKSYGIAAYGTWMADSGFFVDLIAKYSRLESDFEISSMKGSLDNNAYSVSAEFGWHFDVNDLLYVEPQAEFTYGRVMGDNTLTSNGVKVDQDDYDSVLGRVGVRAGLKFPGNRGSIYARVSGVYDFDGESSATYSKGQGDPAYYKDDLGGAWVEYAVGANFNLSENAYTYVDLERTSGGDITEQWRWNVGLRYVW